MKNIKSIQTWTIYGNLLKRKTHKKVGENDITDEEWVNHFKKWLTDTQLDIVNEFHAQVLSDIDNPTCSEGDCIPDKREIDFKKDTRTRNWKFNKGCENGKAPGLDGFTKFFWEGWNTNALFKHINCSIAY